MKVIRTDQDFNLIESCIDKTIDRSKEFPENVFKGGFKYYLFMQFDDILQEILYIHLKQYLLETGDGEHEFWVAAVSPDAKSYFRAHYDYYATIEFTLSDTEDDILKAFNEYPVENWADSITVRPDSLIVSSYLNKWAVYGEREWEIAVCAFCDRAEMEKFRSIKSGLLTWNVEEATEYLMELFGRLPYYKSDKKRMDALKKFCNELRQNYRSSH
jgi:hypothetical protein